MQRLSKVMLAITLGMTSALVIAKNRVETMRETGDATTRLIDVTTENCLANNPSSAGQLQCFTHAEESWGTELNRVYQALQQRLKPTGQDALKQAQRTWLVQRDQEFALINALYAQLDGTKWLPVMASQRADVVRSRTVMLNAYLSSLDRDE